MYVDVWMDLLNRSPLDESTYILSFIASLYLQLSVLTVNTCNYSWNVHVNLDYQNFLFL